jgi:hypothetical protein
MQALVRFALGGEEHRLARAVRLEDAGTERPGEHGSVRWQHGLGAAEDGNVVPVAKAVVEYPPCELCARLRVADDHCGACAAQSIERPSSRLLVLSHRIDEHFALQSSVEANL